VASSSNSIPSLSAPNFIRTAGFTKQRKTSDQLSNPPRFDTDAFDQSFAGEGRKRPYLDQFGGFETGHHVARLELYLEVSMIEERLLLPMAERKRGGESLPLAARLRVDHGALAALMTLPPTHGTFRAVNAVLKAHNPLKTIRAEFMTNAKRS
jgi:hypothetical protein